MAHDLRADLDELLPECRQRPVLDLLRQRQCAQEVAEVISERMELKPDGIVADDRMWLFAAVIVGNIVYPQ